MTTATAKTAKKTGLTAFARDKAGKGAARSLRREGKVPAIVYSHGSKPLSIALKDNELRQEYLRGRFRSRLIDITLDGKIIKALPKEVQFHPVSDQIEHVDFIKIEAGVAIRVQIPVKFVGQEKSAGIKRGGVLNIVRHEIEFICDPASIPVHIEVNVEAMDIGNSIHINDITLPKGIESVLKRNFTVATVAGRSASMEEEVTTTAAATTVEGAVPAEGDAAAAGAPGAAPGAAPAAGAAAPAEGAKKDEGKKDKK